MNVHEMTILIGHNNDTDTGDDHTTDYGSGLAIFIVLLGLIGIGIVFSTPWFMGDDYYKPLYPVRGQKVVLVQGKPVAANAPTVAVASPGGTLVGAAGPVVVGATPDLSCLKSV